MYEWLRNMDNSVGIDCGNGRVRWAEESKGGKTETIVIKEQ